MKSYSIYAGLDVHKETISVGTAERKGGVAKYVGIISSDRKSVDKLLSKFKVGEVHFCYEAGPTGYGLCRYLRSKGYSCEVIAPSLIPVRRGDRIKTNRRDALKLASLSRAGELTPIEV